MRISEMVKKYIAIDLVIGALITIGIWTSIGTEGMAAKFCELTAVAKCDEIEWSEEYAPGKGSSPEPREADQKNQGPEEGDAGTEKILSLK